MRRILDNSSETIATTAFTVAGGSKQAGANTLSISAAVTVTVNTPATSTFTTNDSTSVFTATAHGLNLGQAVTVTNSGGALPTGLATSTTYYAIPLTANTFQLATTLANAQAGTNLTVSSNGTGTNSVVPTALATATVQLQKSNDNANWASDGSSVSVTGSGTYWLEDDTPAAKYYRVNYALASGSFSASTVFCLKGEAS